MIGRIAFRCVKIGVRREVIQAKQHQSHVQLTSNGRMCTPKVFQYFLSYTLVATDEKYVGMEVMRLTDLPNVGRLPAELSVLHDAPTFSQRLAHKSETYRGNFIVLAWDGR